MKITRLRLILAAAAVMIPATVHAVTIDVLWTSGDAAYNADITTLAAGAGSYDPDGNGALDWNLTFWDGTSDPGFENYDVLVIGSTCNVSGTGDCGSGGGFYGLNIDAQGVLDYGDEITAARGSRTFLSGQDADWHLHNNIGFVDDGPRGFLINAVNWAASGTDLGIVSMTDRLPTNDGWWTHADSFLAGELAIADAFAYTTEIVNIGPGQENFPVNEGLTSAGLSYWYNSSHACFEEVTGYDRINITPHPQFSDGTQCGVTLVTAGLADGGTDGGDETNVVPLPAGVWLMLSAVMGFGWLRRKS